MNQAPELLWTPHPSIRITLLLQHGGAYVPSPVHLLGDTWIKRFAESIRVEVTSRGPWPGYVARFTLGWITARGEAFLRGGGDSTVAHPKCVKGEVQFDDVECFMMVKAYADAVCEFANSQSGIQCEVVPLRAKAKA